MKFNKDTARKWKHFFLVVKKHYKESNVSDSAVVIAFYSLLSVFPATIIAGNLLDLLHVNQYEILDYLEPLLPSTVFKTVSPIVISALNGANADKLSIGLIVAIWSASRALAAFQRAVNSSYGIKNVSNLMNRIVSFVWMLLLVMSLGIFLLFFGFGKVIISYSAYLMGLSKMSVGLFILLRYPLTIIGVFILVLLMYYFVPNVNTKWRYVWMGSLIVTISMIVLSKGFSIYLHYFARSVDAYKTLGTFIVLMLWLYIIGMILILGAVINASVQDVKNVEIKDRKPSIKSFIPNKKN
ncbi:YihY/virulence factor BrkB family protein [Apilactobacillus kunkeei]|uniref:YihY/virulence factor BrkB family protein n=1 Tax=Apilactobacillus kunkeei TaxID=148814 RepID=UPI004033600B